VGIEPESRELVRALLGAAPREAREIWPDGEAGPPRFAYGFDARLKGTPAWRTVLAGTFVGASATLGAGTLALDFDALWTLGMADLDAPHGLLFVQYDRASEPRTIALALDQDGFGLEQFGYTFAGYADGGGRFDYAFRNAGGGTCSSCRPGSTRSGRGGPRSRSPPRPAGPGRSGSAGTRPRA
jgi:hypothetical protein